MARRPGPSFRALLFRCGEGAACEPSRLEDRQLRELVFLSVQKATAHAPQKICPGVGGRGRSPLYCKLQCFESALRVRGRRGGGGGY